MYTLLRLNLNFEPELDHVTLTCNNGSVMTTLHCTYSGYLGWAGLGWYRWGTVASGPGGLPT